MPVLNQWTISPNLDQILSAQGIDSRVVAQQKPSIRNLAQIALETGKNVLEPQIIYERYPVQKGLSGQILLGESVCINSQGLYQELLHADWLLVGVATLGNRFDQLTRADSSTDLPLRIALDGLGTAAMDELLTNFCQHISQICQSESLFSSTPFSPGSAGWDTGEGQDQIFQLVDASKIGVSLNESRMMIPRMSCSFVIGLSGIPFAHQGKCDVCGAYTRCIYRKNRQCE